MSEQPKMEWCAACCFKHDPDLDCLEAARQSRSQPPLKRVDPPAASDAADRLTRQSVWSYDAACDVLYVGWEQTTHGEESEPGVIVRRTEDGRVGGVTFVDVTRLLASARRSGEARPLEEGAHLAAALETYAVESPVSPQHATDLRRAAALLREVGEARPSLVEQIASFVEHLRDDYVSTMEPVTKVARLIRERFSASSAPTGEARPSPPNNCAMPPTDYHDPRTWATGAPTGEARKVFGDDVGATRPSSPRKQCACAQPDPVMQADYRFYCYTCSLPVPAVLCDRCHQAVVEVGEARPSPDLQATRDALYQLWQAIITRSSLSFINPPLHAAIARACDVLGVTSDGENESAPTGEARTPLDKS